MKHLQDLASDFGARNLLVVLAISALSIGSYAATSTITNTTLAAQYGVSYNVTGNFTAIDRGFTTTPGNTAASAQPCTWTNGATCSTTMTRGTYRYSLSLTLTSPVSAPTTYTVLVQWDQGSGEATLGTLTVNVPTTALGGQQMTFRFNTGGTSITSPLSMDITVA